MGKVPMQAPGKECNPGRVRGAHEAMGLLRGCLSHWNRLNDSTVTIPSRQGRPVVPLYPLGTRDTETPRKGQR